VIMGNTALWKALQERDALYEKPHEQLTDTDGMRLGELEGTVGEEAATPPKPMPRSCSWAWRGRFAPRAQDERVARRAKNPRAAGAGALRQSRGVAAGRATNHLDLDSVHWLQDYLCEYHGILIVISHDRHFLNSVCTQTADIDYQT